MQNLKWIAAVPAVVGLLFLFFGLIRQGVVQLVVAVAFLRSLWVYESRPPVAGSWFSRVASSSAGCESLTAACPAADTFGACFYR